MKERELREHATCSLCNQRIGHTGLPLFWTVKIERLTAERDDLRRQLAEAEMDAERYRWLRANREFCVAAYPEGEWVIPAGMVFLGYSNPDADSWIDAARSLESSNE